jgi:hypothetical protein
VIDWLAVFFNRIDGNHFTGLAFEVEDAEGGLFPKWRTLREIFSPRKARAIRKVKPLTLSIPMIGKRSRRKIRFYCPQH